VSQHSQEANVSVPAAMQTISPDISVVFSFILDLLSSIRCPIEHLLPNRSLLTNVCATISLCVRHFISDSPPCFSRRECTTSSAHHSSIGIISATASRNSSTECFQQEIAGGAPSHIPAPFLLPFPRAPRLAWLKPEPPPSGRSPHTDRTQKLRSIALSICELSQRGRTSGGSDLDFSEEMDV